MSNNALTFTDSVICYKELIDKEDTARREWKNRFGAKYGAGKNATDWRPVEPFEAKGASNSKTELPSGIPAAAYVLERWNHQASQMLVTLTALLTKHNMCCACRLRNPPQFRDTVGNDGLAGGTKNCFGGVWDIVTPKVVDEEPKQRVVKKGPHDCYCEIGYNCWSMAGKMRTVNHGLMGTFEREFWTNTPGEMAMVWDSNGELGNSGRSGKSSM